MAFFYSHFEKALRLSAKTMANGRLQGATNVIVADVGNPALTETAPAPYELFGPGDVQRLAAGAITRRFPAPNASNAEVTKLALVEFAADDLPWRYTPRLVADGKLRPWLVLVVGQRAPDDIILRPDGRVTLGLTAQRNHPLSLSSLWAHVHDVDGHGPIARVVAPVAGAGYLKDTEYVACVVPAFTATGADAWDGSAFATCDLYVPPGPTAEAVVVFRTSLFRRYPATVVYLSPATPPWVPPPANAALKAEKPTFTGTIGNDITFFGFALPPEALLDHWVVLEEPPAGYRFYHDPPSPPAAAPGLAGSSSNFAFQHFAVPVRVLIGPLLAADAEPV
jgi:hypothetical protein